MLFDNIPVNGDVFSPRSFVSASLELEAVRKLASFNLLTLGSYLLKLGSYLLKLGSYLVDYKIWV